MEQHDPNIQYEPPKTCGLAVASLILGIAGFLSCALTGLIGLILGIIGLSAISKSNGQLSGKGLAVAGIITSSVSLVIAPLLILTAILMPALSTARTQARTQVTLSKARQVTLAVIMYSEDNDDNLPSPDYWTEDLAEYLSPGNDLLTIPGNRAGGRAFAMNEHLEGLKTSDISQPHRVPVIFECEFNSPPAGGPELLPQPARSRKGQVICFLDGHVEIVDPLTIDSLIWQPPKPARPVE